MRTLAGVNVMLAHYWSVFFLLGLLVVMAFAWKRFNDPSFPNQKTLPRTVDPLRYLFLKPAYRKARITYVIALLLMVVYVIAGAASADHHVPIPRQPPGI